MYRCISDNNGRFVFSDVDIGMYTICISDNRNVDSMNSYLEYQRIVVAKPGVENLADCFVSKTLDKGELQIVLTWGDKPEDFSI